MIAKNSILSDKVLLKDIYEDFVSSFGKAAITMGHKRITGMVFSVLFLSNRPLSLDDITEELETSKATICGTVKELLKLEFIQKDWVKGSRKDYYIAEKSVNILIQKALKSMLDNRLTSTIAFVERIQQKLDHMQDTGVESQELDTFQDKLKEVKNLNSCLSNLILQFDISK
ncbi:MAG: hypothetical protein COA79_15285 [Planctomycetota bacterium]|nr:MAG: hypothetical protein COA79_15285 [Planctomycetota bacterium]